MMLSVVGPYSSMKCIGESLVGTAVAGLRDLDALVPVLRELGKKHVGYGVLEAHYDVVGDALMKTLEQGLGDAFAPEARRAWEAVYAVVKATMVGDNYR